MYKVSALGYIVPVLSFSWVIGWYSAFGYDYLAHFLFEMIAVVALGSLFLLLVVLPKEHRSLPLYVMGMSFLGTAVLEFAHAIVYPGYTLSSAEYTVDLWIYSRIVMVFGLMLSYIVSTKSLQHSTQKLIRNLSSLLPVFSASLLFLHRYIPDYLFYKLFYKNGATTPLKSSLELIFAASFIFLAWKIRKEPTFFIGAILNASAHVMFISHVDVFGYNIVLGHAFMVSGLNTLVWWAVKKYLILPYREVEELTKQFGGKLNDISNVVEKRVKFLNAIINLNSELMNAQDEKELLGKVVNFISRSPYANFALFQGDKLIAKHPENLPNSVEGYANFEKFKFLGLDAYIKSFDRAIPKLLENLFLHIDILAQNIKNIKELKNLNQKIREQEEIRLNFQRAVSHELKTPLNVINGNLQLIEMGVFGESSNLSETLQSMKNASEYMLELVDNLMDLSRLETGRLIVKCIPLKTGDFEPVVAQYKTLAAQKGLEFDFKFSGEQEFSGDYKLLSSILSNLLSNAVKYTTNGKVKGQMTISEKSVIVEISDTGIGISESLQSKIFEPFVSAGKTNTGSGLGLAIVKKFVDLLHGDISLKSVEGKGSTFKIELPRTEHQFLPNAKRAAEKSIDVLYIEYDPDSRKLVKNLLKEFTVEEASTGREGFEKALALKPKIVITDLGLPDIDGRKLIINLKTREELKNTNFLLYTGAKARHNLLGIPVIEKGSNLQSFLLSIRILMGQKRLILTSNLVDSRDVIKVKDIMKEIVTENVQIRNLDEIDEPELQLYDFIILVLPTDKDIISKVIAKMKALFGKRVVIIFIGSQAKMGT